MKTCHFGINCPSLCNLQCPSDCKHNSCVALKTIKMFNEIHTVFIPNQMLNNLQRKLDKGVFKKGMYNYASIFRHE